MVSGLGYRYLPEELVGFYFILGLEQMVELIPVVVACEQQRCPILCILDQFLVLWGERLGQG